MPILSLDPAQASRRRRPLATVWAGLVLALIASCAPSAPAEAPAPRTTDPAAVAEERITAEGILDHVSFLASDEMRGRDTPSPALERAAEYLADHFGEMGLEPAGDEGSFLQRWPFERLLIDRDDARVAFSTAAPGGEQTRELTYGEDYFAVPAPAVQMEGTPVFAPDPRTAMAGLPEEVAGSPLLVALPEGLGPEFGMVIQTAMQAQASALIVILDEETDAGEMYQIAGALEGGAAGQLPFPVVGIRYDVGDELLSAVGVEFPAPGDPPGASVLEEMTVSLGFRFREQTDEVPNVVALLRGSDPELADEYVVLTAHYDHVGVGPPDETGDSIYNGADDNASGTAVLLQVADVLAALPEAPARSVVFLAVSGEEKGLLGSAHWARHPTVPGEGLVANLNMDMVARNAPDTLYAIGEEYTSMGEWAREVAESHPGLGLVVAPDPEPEEQAFLRSDHYNFVQEGVPALMLTSWLHDDYHAPSDMPDRVDPEKAARVGRLVFLLTHRVASAPDAPHWTEAGEALLEELESQTPPGG